MRRRSARLRTHLALGAAGLGLALAPGAALAAPSATVTIADVGHRPLATADTIDPGSMTIANTSTAGEKIVSIAIDLVERPREPSSQTCASGQVYCVGPAQLPRIAFDPNGGAGDLPGRPLTLDSATGATAFAAPPTYAEPVGGGFGAVTATFPVDVQPNDHPDDFDDGDSATFSFDVDPISIQGATGPAPAAAIAGSELIGATIRITFSDGSTLFNDLSLVPGGVTDARAVLALTDVERGGDPAVVRPFNASVREETAHADQTLIVGGQSNSSGVLMVAKGELDLTGAPGAGGKGVASPFEANTVSDIREIPFTLDERGRAEVPVTLAPGINVITAYVQEAPGAGPVSTPVVFRLDPSIETDPPTVVSIEPAATASEANAHGLAKVVFSEPMDAGTLIGPPPFIFPFGLSIRVTPGSAGEWTDPDYSPIPTIPVADPGSGGTSFVVLYRSLPVGKDPTVGKIGSGQYTVTVRPNVFDIHGNRLAQEVSKTFILGADPPEQPTTPESHQPPTPVPAPTARTGDVVCAPVPARESGVEPGVVRLDASQLLISQRIAQAAVRRANAVDAWLDAGIVAGDLCGNAFGPAEFAGVSWVGGASNPPVAPTPRRIVVAPADEPDGEARDVTLSAAQLLINQRISQAAVRRVDALIDRIDAGLTGGDLADGAMAAGALWTGLKARSSTPATPVARSKTVIGRREGGGGKVRVSVAQLRINQRISQAAVRRVNALIARLQRGLTGAEFKDGSLTAADLGPGARP
jgi:hypothetical protein